MRMWTKKNQQSMNPFSIDGRSIVSPWYLEDGIFVVIFYDVKGNHLKTKVYASDKVKLL